MEVENRPLEDRCPLQTGVVHLHVRCREGTFVVLQVCFCMTPRKTTCRFGDPTIIHHHDPLVFHHQLGSTRFSTAVLITSIQLKLLLPAPTLRHLPDLSTMTPLNLPLFNRSLSCSRPHHGHRACRFDRARIQLQEDSRGAGVRHAGLEAATHRHFPKPPGRPLRFEEGGTGVDATGG